MKTLTWQDIYNTSLHVHCSFIYNSQALEATCVHRGMNKNVGCVYTYTYTCNRILSNIPFDIWNIKKRKSYHDNMDGPWGHYAKWKKSDKERQIYNLNIWSRKTKNPTVNKLIGTEKKLVVSRGRGCFPGNACDKEPTCQCRRIWEMWIRSLSWEDALEEGMATHSSILACSLTGYGPWGCEELDMTEVT